MHRVGESIGYDLAKKEKRKKCVPYIEKGIWFKKNGTICDCKPINIKEMIQKMSWWQDYIEADGLLSMGSHRVRHDWRDLAAAAAAAAAGPNLRAARKNSKGCQDGVHMKNPFMCLRAFLVGVGEALHHSLGGTEAPGLLVGFGWSGSDMVRIKEGSVDSG